MTSRSDLGTQDAVWQKLPTTDMAIQAEPAYAEGFDAAHSGEPLATDASPIFAAGWNGYWTARWVLGGATPESRAYYGLPVEEMTPEGVQLVIPGAEKRLPATAKQMELW